MIKVDNDWDKFHYEEEEKDMMEDFSPENLIEMMRKNGELSDEDDYGPEMPEDEEAKEEGQLGKRQRDEEEEDLEGLKFKDDESNHSSDRE